MMYDLTTTDLNEKPPDFKVEGAAPDDPDACVCLKYEVSDDGNNLSVSVYLPAWGPEGEQLLGEIPIDKLPVIQISFQQTLQMDESGIDISDLTERAFFSLLASYTAKKENAGVVLTLNLKDGQVWETLLPPAGPVQSS